MNGKLLYQFQDILRFSTEGVPLLSSKHLVIVGDEYPDEEMHVTYFSPSIKKYKHLVKIYLNGELSKEKSEIEIWPDNVNEIRDAVREWFTQVPTDVAASRLFDTNLAWVCYDWYRQVDNYKLHSKEESFKKYNVPKFLLDKKFTSVVKRALIRIKYVTLQRFYWNK